MWRTLLSLAIALCLSIGVAEAKPKHKHKPKHPKQQQSQQMPAPALSPEGVFMTLDKNNDGTLTLAEYLAKVTPEVKPQAEKAFKEVDPKGEGLTVQQFTKDFAKLNPQAPQPENK